jgi:predicted amidohydrolase
VGGEPSAPPAIFVHGAANSAPVWTFWQAMLASIVTGTADTQWPRERYHDLWLQADYLSVEGASHWGLVLNRRALETMIPAVACWLTGAVQVPLPRRER